VLASGAMKDAVVQAWWPLARSLDLVRAPLAAVAEHLESEISRTMPPYKATWIEPRRLHDVFASVTTFTSFPTSSSRCLHGVVGPCSGTTRSSATATTRSLTT